MDLTSWLLLLLPVAAFSGYLAGQRRREQGTEQRVAKLSSSYFRGLSLLLDEKTDAAIEAFLEVEDPDADTVETQIALGSLFRRRGEVDRAIRLHQALFDRASISATQRTHALFELGEDFLRAGLLDRAEELYQKLLQIEAQPDRALKALLSIYEQEKDWQRAIAAAERLQSHSRESLAARIAHYHCELADAALAARRCEAALESARAAIAADPRSARARLIEARIALQEGHTLRTLDALAAAAGVDASVIPEALVLWWRAYTDTDYRQAARATLNKLVELDPGVRALLARAEVMGEEQGLAEAEQLLADKLVERPSMALLQRLLKIDAGREDHSALIGKLTVASEVIQRAIDKSPGYRCQRCGFGARTLHWQCPSCKSWSTVKPVDP